MRVYEFSKQYNVSNSELLAALEKGGFSVKSHMSALTDEAFAYLIGLFTKQEEAPPVKKETSAPVIKKEVEKKQEEPLVTKTKPEIKEEKPVQVQTQIKKVEKKAPQSTSLEKKSLETVIDQIIAEPMTVGDFADRTRKSVNDVIVTLLGWGIVAAKNQPIDEKIVERLAAHYQLTVVKPSAARSEIKKQVSDGELGGRLPVVVVMGHVDHGKTTLLDFIRKTRVAAREKGGITQHIGAYEAQTSQGNIVFLDTPGHEAFSKIRQRGSRVADIAILVVAADDGIMPQTVEALKHAREAQIPVIVAINKIDKVDATRLETIKRQLAQYDLLPEEWGGQTIVVPIAAKEGKNIDQLLDMLSLQAQLMELRANLSGHGKGYVIESKIEKGRGSVATVILQHGQLVIGDFFVCGEVVGRVNSLFNSAGERLEKVGPSVPVQISGFEELPDVGDFFTVVSKDEYLVARAKPKLTKTQHFAKENAINLMIKVDTNSTKEALLDSINRVSKAAKHGSFNIVDASVGRISEGDIELAYNTGSEFIGLHTKVEAKAASLAERKKVSIKLFDIIYKLLEYLEERLEHEKEVVFIKKKIGEAEVRKVFDIKGVGVIAGCYVKDGRFTKDGTIVGLRDGVKIGEGKIKSLQREKKTVKEVHTGFECGFVVEGISDWQPGDRAECYIEVPQE